MHRDEFVFSSTAIRSMESKLLTKEQFDRMVDAEWIEGALRVLQESAYADHFSKINRPEDYNQAILAALTELYETVKDLTPDMSVVEIVELKYDAHNMKVLFKDHVMGTDNENLIYPMGKIRVAHVSAKAERGDRKSIDEQLGGMATEAVYEYGDTLDPQAVDFAVDKRFYKWVLETAENSDIDLLKDYARDFVDFSNLITLFRTQRQGRTQDYLRKVITHSGNIDKDEIISLFNEPVSAIADKYKRASIGDRLQKANNAYEANGSLAVFEKELDNHMMDLVKGVKFIAFGPEVIFAYMLAREIEIKNIRIVLVSKLNKLSPEFIRGRLRDVYV